MFRIYFNFVSPTVLEKKSFETKDKIKNDKYVNLIDSEIIDLKKEIEKMSEEEIEIEKPNKIVKKTLKFNNKKTIRRRIKNFNTKPNA